MTTERLDREAAREEAAAFAVCSDPKGRLSVLLRLALDELQAAETRADEAEARLRVTETERDDVVEVLRRWVKYAEDTDMPIVSGARSVLARVDEETP